MTAAGIERTAVLEHHAGPAAEPCGHGFAVRLPERGAVVLVAEDALEPSAALREGRFLPIALSAGLAAGRVRPSNVNVERRIDVLAGKDVEVEIRFVDRRRRGFAESEIVEEECFRFRRPRREAAARAARLFQHADDDRAAIPGGDARTPVPFSAFPAAGSSRFSGQTRRSCRFSTARASRSVGLRLTRWRPL